VLYIEEGRPNIFIKVMRIAQDEKGETEESKVSAITA
jgi:hypothetical protein